MVNTISTTGFGEGNDVVTDPEPGQSAGEWGLEHVESWPSSIPTDSLLSEWTTSGDLTKTLETERAEAEGQSEVDPVFGGRHAARVLASMIDCPPVRGTR